MPKYQITFTNNNDFGVGLYVIPPSGTPLTRVGEVPPHNSLTVPIDHHEGTEWVIVNSETKANFDRYSTTSEAVQSYVIKDNTYLTFINNTASAFSLSSVYSVLPQYNQSHSVRPFSQMTIIWPMSPNSEWQIKDAQTGTINGTYFTNFERFQSFTIKPSPVATPVVTPGGTTVVTPVITPGGTIYSCPVRDNTIVIPTPKGPVVVSAKDSIFNSRSFNVDLVNFDLSIQERTGLTEKNQRRAAVYAALMVIAKAHGRFPREQFLMDWLALQVKQTRVEAARLALAEYDKWQLDPWSYQPPGGYDFPPYTLMPSNSHVWLTTTPNPPVLANESWQSLLADIVSANPWSPLNHPVFTYYGGGQQTSSIEGVIGFPVFGTVLAYQKLFGTDAGARILADATENLSMRFDLSASSGLFASVGEVNWYSQLAGLRSMAMQQISPYTFRQVKDIVRELAKRAGRTLPGLATTKVGLDSIPTEELRATLQKLTSGEILSSFVCTVVLSFALQALIHESLNLSNKVKLRGKLVENFEQQQRAVPDLRNLLYYDIRGEITLFPSDYHPTDPVELERLMGSQEVYRAFLLATIE